ncbi:hypothetical protein IFM89_023049 [Coptis chinensis]|uniref:Uncharacterized protein n=1 Tax=Coptis chinensis TaxID=261450 RepID=A0A835M0S5_9MAGN|nr:hypothetical protein IFM89_023049 [Coptis chinensis]
MARKSSISSSSSNNRWRYIHSSYYLKRPKRLAFLFISFIFLTFFVWDRQSLIREHEAEMTKLSQDLLPLQNQLQEFKSASGETMITNVFKDDLVDVQRRGKVKEVMLHAWTCYENYAWGQDELRGTHIVVRGRHMKEINHAGAGGIWAGLALILSKLEMLKRRGKGPPKKGQGRPAIKCSK